MGGIGSGKSTVGRMLSERGVLVIDADHIGHELLEPGGDAFDPVVRRWPDVVSDGRIARARLAAIVFSDRGRLRELESMTHPLIKRRVEALVDAAENRDVVVEVPLVDGLMGEGWTRIVVVANKPVRIARAVSRGMDRSDVMRRMDAQPGRETWLADADYVIVNDGTPSELAAAVDSLWRDLHHSADS